MIVAWHEISVPKHKTRNKHNNMITPQNNTARPPVTVELPLTPSYNGEGLTMAQQSVQATLDLTGGNRTYDSAPKNVGTHNGMEIHAQLTFSYSYDKDEDKVTIRGNDDATPDQLRITTSLGGEPDLAYYHTPNESGLNVASNHMWTAQVEQAPNLKQAMAATAAACNTALVKALMDAGVSSVLTIGTPPTVTAENLNNFKLMYGETITPLDVTDLPAEIARVQFQVDSTYVGTVTWKANATFANVIGSTDDPKIDGQSWIELWANKCNSGKDTDKCSSYNYASGDPNWKCSSTILGGHVITGTTAKKMNKGDTVYIYPICKPHNNSDANSMKSLYNPEGVQLKYW